MAEGAARDRRALIDRAASWSAGRRPARDRDGHGARAVGTCASACTGRQGMDAAASSSGSAAFRASSPSAPIATMTVCVRMILKLA